MYVYREQGNTLYTLIIFSCFSISVNVFVLGVSLTVKGVRKGMVVRQLGNLWRYRNKRMYVCTCNDTCASKWYEQEVLK